MGLRPRPAGGCLRVKQSSFNASWREQWLTASALGGLVSAASVAMLWPGEDAHGRTLALVGLYRMREPVRWQTPELAIAAGLVYIAVGGTWTFASRLGKGFFGFDEPLVLLTGAHFHYAGLLLPILTGLAARNLRSRLAS